MEQLKKLFLELSQVVDAETEREIELKKERDRYKRILYKMAMEDFSESFGCSSLAGLSQEKESHFEDKLDKWESEYDLKD